MQSCGVSGRLGRGGRLGRSEPRMPRPERLLKRAVEYRHTHGEERLDRLAVPSHLLFLNHPLGDDLIHG